VSAERGRSPGTLAGPVLPDLGADLLSAAAHELKTPLSVIAGYTELLAIRDSPELRREAVSTIALATGELNGAVDDAVALLQALSPAGELHLERLDLESVVALAAGIVSGRQQGCRLAVESVPGGWPEVVCDAELLSQAIRALLRSACRALAEADGMVEVSAERRADSVALTVSALPDVDGDGPFLPVPEREWSHLGGLGLYAARRIVERCRAAVAVERAPGGAIRYRLELPAR
jgi:K+-sensing histidine kinase KdpD